MTIDASLTTPATAKAFGKPKKKGCPYALARRLLCRLSQAAAYAALDSLVLEALREVQAERRP